MMSPFDMTNDMPFGIIYDALFGMLAPFLLGETSVETGQRKTDKPRYDKPSQGDRKRKRKKRQEKERKSPWGNYTLFSPV